MLKVVSFGIRNLSKPEMDFYNNNKDRIKIFWGKDKKNGIYLKIDEFF